MRTLLAGELALAQDYRSDYYVKLEVQNGSGTWVDVGALLGTHWIINATWGESRDEPVSQATFTLLMRIGSASLAPLVTASVLNVDDTMAYAPLLWIGRLMRAWTATMAHGVALDVSKYRPAFVGRIDDVAGMDSPYNNGPITIQCSDLGAWLMDLQIEVEGKEYGDPDTPPDLEDVLQSVINDNIPAGEPAVTLVKESSSSFGVTGWKQGETKLLESLVTLVLDSTGEDVRYRFDASHVSQLMWFDPDRDRVTVDATFTQYIMRQLDMALRDIRNAGEMAYTDSVTGEAGVVTATDPASIALYRRRFLRVPPSTMLTTEAESQTVIDAVINDLSGPPAEASIAIPFAWFVQLYDRYTFTAGQQYDTDQTFAISGYQHSIENSRGSTVLSPCTARIVGAYAAWQKRLKGPAADADRSLKDFRIFEETDTEVTYKWVPGPYVLEVWLGVVAFVNPVPTDPWAIVTGAAPATAGATVLLPMSPLPDGTVSYTFTKPQEGSVLYAQLEPRDANLLPGSVQRLVINAAPTQPPIIELDDSESTTVGTQWWKITERGIAVVAVEVQTQVGVEPISAFGAPTRGPGGASTVRGGTLGAGEYEHDVNLDPTRLSWIMPRVTLENGSPPIVLGPFGFDRDKNPNLLSVILTGTVISILADTDTKSIRVFDTLGTWEYVLDGLSATIDVSKVGTNGVAGLGSTATSTFTIQARSDPTAYVTGGTLIVTQNLVISGGGASPPAATWDSPGLTAQAPGIGSGTMTIHLKATSAPGSWTVKLWAGPNNNPSVDITAAVSPALSAPPTVDTTYSYATGATAVSGSPREIVVYAVRADLIDNLGAVVDTRIVHPAWYKHP